ncbi:MAG: T9SS C-terminal target domain-containing protein [Bacteroidetes bacterium]|nr:MAG: T9SS C-terminal target domain-containing protein [Bacteroidota bacterium]REK34606.1 MAG: T9SS C-terminal target domain-containing protein [Bacteroidota bacterium]
MNQSKIISLVGFMCLTLVSFAQPGTLDLSFNSGTAANFEVYTTSIQSDGKIIIGGAFNMYNGVSSIRLARLHTDGTLDNSFNSGTGPNQIVYATAIQPDGKIIVGGDFTSYNGSVSNFIVRINVNGTIDNTFNIFGVGANDRVNTISVQTDGKIIIGGYFTSYNGISRNYIARLNNDGSLDNTFDPGMGANNWLFTTEIQPDGKIIIGGDFTSYNLTSSNRIVRLNTDGTVDNTFNIGSGASSGIRAITYQPDGKIIVGGNFTSFNGVGANYITRLNTDGTLDNTFNPGTGANNGIYSTLLLPDGKIIIVGAFTLYDGTSRNRIARINSDGTLDNIFNPGVGSDSWIITSNLQPDGKIVVGGNFTSYNGSLSNRICRITNTCISSSGIDVITACNAYTWIDGNNYTASNNTATYNIIGGSANGCDSLVTLNLTINYVSDLTTTTAANSIITANNPNANYQWLDCNNNYTIITGAINQSYAPIVNGSFAVELTENGCVDTSTCVLITTVGIIENTFNSPITVYPNPTQGQLIIVSQKELRNTSLTLRNIMGQEVFRKNYSSVNRIDLTREVSSGVYFVEIIDGEKKAVFKIIVE